MSEPKESQPSYLPGLGLEGAAVAYTAPSSAKDEADHLLNNADAFLRLGLVKQAIKHLADALRRTPSLRALREPLVKLYLSQQQHMEAIAELWALARTSHDPGEEERYLRHILHLDGRQREALKRLEKLQSSPPSAPSQPQADTRPSARALGPQRQTESDAMGRAPATAHAQTVASTKSRQSQPVPAEPRSQPASQGADATSILKKGMILRSFGQLRPASLLFQSIVQDESCGIRATLLLGQCQRDLGQTDEAIETFLSGMNRENADEDDLSELFYELGRSYERLTNVKVATLYYHLAIGSTDSFRDAHERIASLRARKPKL